MKCTHAIATIQFSDTYFSASGGDPHQPGGGGRLVYAAAKAVDAQTTAT